MLSMRHWCWVVLPLIAIAASFWHLGTGSLHDWDEAIYAQVSKEMNESGDWLRPHYGYKPWIDKPPLLMDRLSGADALDSISRMLILRCRGTLEMPVFISEY